MRKTIKIKIISAALTLAAAVSLFTSLDPSAYADSGHDAVQTVRVGFYALDGYHDMTPDGRLSGYGYDFLQMVSRYTDLNFEYVGYDRSFSDMQDMLSDGEIDLLSPAAKTDGREAKFLYSNEPIGSSTVKLNVRLGDDRFTGSNFADYSGMTIGLLGSDSRNVDLDRFARANGFTYRVKYYSDSESLAYALQDGRVDALATSSLRKISDEKTVNEFSSENFFAITTQDNAALMDKINYAVSQMDLYEGDWRYNLKEKYYSSRIDTLVLTPSEKEAVSEYTSGNKVLSVAVNPANKPYSFFQDGRMQGILPDIFDEIMQKTGMNYKYIATMNASKYRDIAQSGEADIILDAVTDVSTLEKRGYLTTNSVMTMNVARLTHTNFTGEVKKAGFVDWLDLSDEINLEDTEIVYYKTLSALADAVRNAEIDAGYTYLYSAQTLLNSNGQGKLVCTTLPEKNYDVRIAVNRSLDHELCSAINKGLETMDELRRYEILSRYLEYSAMDTQFDSWLSMHPQAIAFISALGMLVLGVIIFLLLRARNERSHRMEMAEISAEAQAANRAKTVFLFNMSHDIRTPMNAITGYTAMAKRHIDNTAEVKDYLDKIDISGRQLLSLVNQVLEMARIEAGTVSLNAEHADIIERTYAMHTMAGADAKIKNIDYSVVIREIRHKDVLTDVSQMNRIFTNIVSNAVKYTPEGGKVTYTVEEKPCDKEGYGLYVISVEDNGIGMSEEFLKHIYDSFSRERNSTTSGIQGTGLGMSIVRDLVHLMDGTIDIKSKQGKGTTVTVSVPLKWDDTPCAQDKSNQDLSLSIEGKRLLLVEDNEMNREIAKDILEESGAEITEAENGAIALEKINKERAGYFDAVLMDIQMPVMNGYEATKAIRELEDKAKASIPVIAVSANAFDEDRRASLDAGMNDHIAKPIDVDQLKETLAKYL